MSSQADPAAAPETTDEVGDELDEQTSQRPDVGGGGRIPKLVARVHVLIEEAEPAASEGCNTRAVGTRSVGGPPDADQDEDDEHGSEENGEASA